jgi:hypothetical protein
MIERRPRIIDVERKPQKCPVCGERVVDIIYGTGDMTEIEFFLEYRKEGMMGGDNIPRPPIWECVCGCRRFRKVNWDGTDAPVKVKMLKNVRKELATLINWESNMAIDAVGRKEFRKLHHYKVEVRTELGEKEIVSVNAVNEQDVEDLALSLVMKGSLGLKGRACTYNVMVDEE